MENSKHPLTVSELSVKMKKNIFSNISLDLKEGEFVTLMGENGVGKTIFTECLLGCHTPKTGEALFWGMNMYHHRREINEKVGWVPSQPENWPNWMKVGQFLEWIASVYPSWNHELCEKLVSRFSLGKGKKLNHLSMGEASKVRLVKALSFEPKLLILDELTANLSEKSKNVVLETLLELFHDNKMSVLYISHSTEEALKLSDRVFEFQANGLKEVQNA